MGSLRGGQSPVTVPNTTGAAQNHLAAEIEPEPAVADPADEGVDRAAALRADDDALAEAGFERAFDHRAAARDVDHRHRIFAAAEDEDSAFDEAFVARLGPLLDGFGTQLQGRLPSPFPLSG